jgi:hypothetical protein
LGKSPLQRIVKRIWHDCDSFTDVLACGHSVRHFAAESFEWQDGHMVNLPPKQKRRRCQQCKAAAELARRRPGSVADVRKARTA